MNPDNEPLTADRIETVLAGLRDVRPAPGLEQRITAALLREIDAASGPKPRSAWLRLPQAAGVAAAFAAAVTVSIQVYRRPSAAPTTNRAALQLAADSRAGKAAAFSPSDPAIAHEGLQPHTLHAGAKAPFQRQRKSGLNAAAFSGNIEGTPARSSGARTRDVARAAAPPQPQRGFPAPPLPLTEQERLLIRLVHRDDPVQLAQLAPAAREAQLRRDSEQVRDFFKPPPMPPANFKLEPYPVLGGSQ